MQNVVMRREGDKLIVEIDLKQDLGPSTSGKTHIIASTRGNAPVPGTTDSYIGINCFRYPEPKKARTGSTKE